VFVCLFVCLFAAISEPHSKDAQSLAWFVLRQLQPQLEKFATELPEEISGWRSRIDAILEVGKELQDSDGSSYVSSTSSSMSSASPQPSHSQHEAVVADLHLQLAEQHNVVQSLQSKVQELSKSSGGSDENYKQIQKAHEEAKQRVATQDRELATVKVSSQEMAAELDKLKKEFEVKMKWRDRRMERMKRHYESREATLGLLTKANSREKMLMRSISNLQTLVRTETDSQMVHDQLQEMLVMSSKELATASPICHTTNCAHCKAIHASLIEAEQSVDVEESPLPTNIRSIHLELEKANRDASRHESAADLAIAHIDELHSQFIRCQAELELLRGCYENGSNPMAVPEALKRFAEALISDSINQSKRLELVVQDKVASLANRMEILNRKLKAGAPMKVVGARSTRPPGPAGPAGPPGKPPRPNMPAPRGPSNAAPGTTAPKPAPVITADGKKDFTGSPSIRSIAPGEQTGGAAKPAGIVSRAKQQPQANGEAGNGHSRTRSQSFAEPSTPSPPNTTRHSRSSSLSSSPSTLALTITPSTPIVVNIPFPGKKDGLKPIMLSKTPPGKATRIVFECRHTETRVLVCAQVSATRATIEEATGTFPSFTELSSLDENDRTAVLSSMCSLVAEVKPIAVLFGFDDWIVNNDPFTISSVDKTIDAATRMIASNAAQNVVVDVLKLPSNEMWAFNTLSVEKAAELIGLPTANLQVWLDDQSLRLAVGSSKTPTEQQTPLVSRIGVELGRNQLSERGIMALGALRSTWAAQIEQLKSNGTFPLPRGHCFALRSCVEAAQAVGINTQPNLVKNVIQLFEQKLDALRAEYENDPNAPVDTEYASVMSTLVCLIAVFSQLAHPDSTVTFQGDWVIHGRTVHETWVIGWLLTTLPRFDDAANGAGVPLEFQVSREKILPVYLFVWFCACSDLFRLRV
jgi:hypothetical protein